jgi:hypothetical protein
LIALLRAPQTPDISSFESGTARSARARVARALEIARDFVRPQWLIGHLIVVALAVTMVFLGRWQLNVSNSKHFDLQNFGYALQWWAFAAFGLFMWVRIMQHHVNPPEQITVSTGLVLASRGQLARIGPMELAMPGTAAGEEPVIYRGYVMPQTSDGLIRTEDDPVHDSYNDYLWQLAMADGETPKGQTSGDV